MSEPLKRRGRPRRYTEYDELLASLPPEMTKRPKYVNGIGLFRGQQGITAWLKVTLPNGGTYRDRAYEPGESAEIKLGKLSSWTWEKLEAKRGELIGRADRGDPLEDTPVVRFSTFAKAWHADREETVKGWKVEQGHLNNSLLPYFGDKDLNAITFQDVNKWQAKQLEALGPATVQRQLTTLKTICNDAKRAGKLKHNPCTGAKKIRGIEPRQRYLEIEEAGRLVSEAAKVTEWMPDFLTWLLHSGMRRGEALGLTWKDIKRVGDLMVVSIANTKAGKPRFITCSTDMEAILERQRKRKSEGDRVFPIALITLKRAMAKLRALTGVEDIRLHDLRRTNATHLARDGVDLRTLSGRIGHADLTMLHSVYSVFDKDDNAAEAAQRVFGKAVPSTRQTT